MGQGSAIVKNYKEKYFNIVDYDIRLGGDYTFLFEPLNGWENEKFFYVKDMGNGTFEVTGEGYIITDKDNYKRYLSSLRQELKAKSVIYYHIDEKNNIVEKERSEI